MDSEKETNIFLTSANYSKGPAGELRSQIYIGIKIEYVAKDVGKLWLNEVAEISNVIRIH